MKGVNKIGFSVAKPKLKASKMSFVRAKKAQTIKAEDLKGQETVSTTSLVSTLSETNRILVEIQNQLAIDFANRIAERKAVIKASKLGVRKKKLVEKEDFVERGKGFFGNIKEFGKKVLSPLSNIFDKIKNFLLLVGGGILLNNAWEWLSKKENRERLIAVLTFLKNHWKTIVGLIVGVKLLGAVRKLIKLVKSLRNLLRGIKPPRTGTGGSKTPFDCNAMWRCFTSSAAIPFAVMSAIALGVFELFKNGGLFPEFQGVFNPNKGKQEPGTTLASNQQPVSATTTAQQQSEPLKSFTGREIPTSLAGVLSELQAEYAKTGKPASRLTPQGFLSVRATAPNRLGLLGGPDLTPQISFNPELTQESNQAAVAQAGTLFSIANLPATLAPILGARGAIGRSISSASKRSGLEGFRAPNVPPVQMPTQPSTYQLRDTILSRLLRRSPDRPKKFITTSRSGLGDRAAKSTETSVQGERARRDVERDLKDDNFEQFLKLLQDTGQATLTNDPKIPKRSEGGTIPGKGPQNVDSVPAMLAPGEEVIRASAANIFRPVLKDINNNAGRLFGEFRSGVEQQKTDLSLQRDTTEKSIGILSDFKEFIEGFTNRLKIEKAKRDVELFRDIFGPGNDTSGDSSVKTSPIPEISQQTFTPSSLTLPSFTQQEPQDQSLNFDQMPLMKYIRAQEQKPKPIDQSLRRRNTTSTTEAQVATATLPMQTIQLQPDPMPMKEQPQEYAEEKIEIQPMDMSNPYIPFTLNNYNLG